MDEQKPNRWREERKKLQGALSVKTAGFLLTALGLVAGLAWNDAISALIQQLFPLAKDSIIAKIAYAGLITVLVVIASVYLDRSDKNSQNS